ncbi:MAG: ASCH domain-containing protein [Candidatus Altiarchaeota archaeon]|nr:ASCH domain-containing protein [Candidatus Altiarchaeota archaeon]
MKALSLKQPWAELIVSGKKTIETRTWNTKFRGKFLVHASKTLDRLACQRFGFDTHELEQGAIIGQAELVDTKEYMTQQDYLDDSEKHLAAHWEFKRPKFGFVLVDVTRLKPIKYKGALGFFETQI